MAINKALQSAAKINQPQRSDVVNGGEDHIMPESRDREQEQLVVDSVWNQLDSLEFDEHNLRLFQEQLPVRIDYQLCLNQQGHHSCVICWYHY